MRRRLRVSINLASLVIWLAFAASSSSALQNAGSGSLLFEETFEHDLSKWRLHEDQAFRLIDAGDSAHGKALELAPAGVAYALIKG